MKRLPHLARAGLLSPCADDAPVFTQPGNRTAHWLTHARAKAGLLQSGAGRGLYTKQEVGGVTAPRGKSLGRLSSVTAGSGAAGYASATEAVRAVVNFDAITVSRGAVFGGAGASIVP